jgi:hypothetical protein
MIRYIEHIDQIFDRETGGYIPKTTGNNEYREFLAWVAEGNTPIPEKPGPEYVLDEDTWIIDADLAENVESAAAAAYLDSTANLVRRYEEDLAAGRRRFIPESKYQNILRKRARALKKLV